MADQTVTITFNDDVLSNGQGGSATVTGYAIVDYTNGSYNLNVKITFSNGGGFVTEQEYVGPGSMIDKGNQNYMIGSKGDTFSFGYNTKTPSFTGTMVYTGNTPNYIGGGSLSSVAGGTVTPLPICFVTGTRIGTTRGEIPVEALKVGDRAVTATGATRSIAWVGHKVMGGSGNRIPFEARPVRIAAGAFGPGVPERELWLSPGHPVLVGAEADGKGGHLVPIMCLINGTTIARMPVDGVTYWHVELDAHDILLAEGLPAESYLDWGDRPFFTEGVDHALANPDFVVPGLAGRCRPVALDGPVVEAERRRLDTVFATQLVDACAWPTAADALVLS